MSYDHPGIHSFNKFIIFVIILLLIYLFILKVRYYNRLSLNSLSPELISFLNNYGEYIIHKIKICKRIVHDTLQLGFELLTQIDDRNGIKLVNPNHVYFVITVSPADDIDNKINIILEKNEVVDMYLESEIKEKMLAAGLNVDEELKEDCISVLEDIHDIVPTFTINNLIRSAIDKMNNKFYYYDCITNNCQVFANKLTDMLKAKKELKPRINTKFNKKFYFQPNTYIQLKPYESALMTSKLLTDIMRIIRFWKN